MLWLITRVLKSCVLSLFVKAMDCLFLATLPALAQLGEVSKSVSFLFHFHSSLYQANHLHLLNPTKANPFLGLNGLSL